jgi:hypothetical protein
VAVRSSASRDDVDDASVYEESSSHDDVDGGVVGAADAARMVTILDAADGTDVADDGTVEAVRVVGANDAIDGAGVRGVGVNDAVAGCGGLGGVGTRAAVRVGGCVDVSAATDTIVGSFDEAVGCGDSDRVLAGPSRRAAGDGGETDGVRERAGADLRAIESP